MLYTYLDSPIGKLFLAKDSEGLRFVKYAKNVDGAKIPKSWKEARDDFKEEQKQFEEYFSGERSYFSLKITPDGTAFQKSVLHALQKIPYGQTRTYGQIAQEIGQPNAARAVGMANNRNPLSIVIPCHRVIGADGKLTGYAGGLEIKEKLLNHEQSTSVSEN